jgi:hypothetical protein
MGEFCCVGFYVGGKKRFCTANEGEGGRHWNVFLLFFDYSISYIFPILWKYIIHKTSVYYAQ